MKKLLNLLLVVILFTSTIKSSHAEVDPRMKALGTVALYGTVGGALLGVATLAFDGEGRNVAIGASVGLYIGLIFGGYIVYAHYRNRNPRTEPAQYPSDEGSPYAEDREPPQFWNPKSVMPQDLTLHKSIHEEQNSFGKSKINEVPIYVDLFKYSF